MMEKPIQYAISTFAILDQPFAQGITKLVQLGWKKIEIMCEGSGLECLNWSDEQAREFTGLVKEQGLEITFHAPITASNPASFDPEIKNHTMNQLIKCFDLALQWDSPYVLLHLGEAEDRVKGLNNVIHFIDELLQRFPIGPKLVIENVPPYPQLIGAKVDDLIEVCQRVNQPERLGIVYDIGHGHLINEGYVISGLQEVLPYLIGLHLSDNHGVKDEHLALGKGTIPMEVVVNILHSNSKMDLSLVIENRSEEESKNSITYLENILIKSKV